VLHLTGAAILVSRGVTLLQAAPAGERGRSAAARTAASVWLRAVPLHWPLGSGGCYAPCQLFRVRAADFNRSRIVPTVRAPESRRTPGFDRAEVLRVLADRNHPVSELRNAKLCGTCSEHLHRTLEYLRVWS